MLRLLLILSIVLLSAIVNAQDPVKADGDKYKVLLENEQVQVLEYRDRPGEKTYQHRHPAFVLYAISAFKRTIPDVEILKIIISIPLNRGSDI